jgi:hypothetical protein
MATRRLAGLTGIHRRRAVIAAAAAALLAFTSLAAASTANSASSTSTPASGTPVAGPAPISTAPGGWLVLETGVTNSVTYDANRDGIADRTQVLAGNATTCQLSSSGDPLLTFTGTVTGKAGNLASLKSGSIGVGDRSSGSNCSRINGTNERLDLALNLGRPVATAAYLDVVVKGNARILATAYLTGNPNPVGRFELRSGSARTQFDDPLATQTFRCVGTADDDDHEAEDCRWPISTPTWMGDDGINFDSLSIQALAGSVSLQGGTNGTVPPTPPGAPIAFPARGSVFELADGVLGCEDTTSTIPAEGTAPQVSVKRLQNVAGGPSCSPISYSLSHTANTVTFLKPLALQTNAQFVISVVWSNPVPAGPATLTATTADFQAGSGPVPLGWCADPLFSGDGSGVGPGNTTLIGITNPAAQPDFEPVLLPGVQYACIGSSSTSVVLGSPNTLQVTEQIYLEGDITFNRGG